MFLPSPFAIIPKGSVELHRSLHRFFFLLSYSAQKESQIWTRAAKFCKTTKIQPAMFEQILIQLLQEQNIPKPYFHSSGTCLSQNTVCLQVTCCAHNSFSK